MKQNYKTYQHKQQKKLKKLKFVVRLNKDKERNISKKYTYLIKKKIKLIKNKSKKK